MKSTKWSPPPAGKYKLNVDAAFIPETGVGGIGAVVRNDNGEVMAAMALPLARVVNDVKKDEEESWASDGHLIGDIKRSLQHFEDVIISYSPRGANQVAHFLAKHALNCNTMVTWIEEVPFWLESIVNDDMVVSS
ncbi:hypothetical protein PRUPE_6G272800 [Prunus persica]|uniref:RNase H type-1 domain-containing protein n=1 Tax=Prunus persica TaxID=3760 RepID=A0A251NWJ8_PRUPE|nr:hypothetical protein PRUPE_6G272800 [Prunus persica]